LCHGVGMVYDSDDIQDMSWADLGRCAGIDPEVFFPGRGQDAAPAKALCRECPVRRQCLTWALQTGQKHGIWGGMTDNQRRRLKRVAATRPAVVSTVASPPTATGAARAVRHLQLVR
ncbi:MAG: WhiB family transcriptional regulator, partial [Ilumatobacteraceae bacterium]